MHNVTSNRRKRLTQLNISSLRRCALIGCSMVALLTSTSSVAQQVNYMQRGKKDVHKVQDGDTLYDLSGRYTGEVYNWPEIWSYNPHITNPHWIYPGDLVYLRPPGDPAPTPDAFTQSTELHVAVGGFIAKDELKYVGRITASPKQATLLSELDTVWVGFGDESYTPEEQEDLSDEDRIAFRNPEEEVKVGDMYAIVRPAGEVLSNDGEERVLGHKYMMLGSLKIQEVSDKYLNTAEITQSWYEMERGDLLIPYEQQLKRIDIIQSEQNLVAKITDTVEPRTALGEFHYVIVDKGEEDNVRAGNRFYVFQRREGLQKYDEPTSDKIPWERIGQVLLIDVREDYSTGIIIDSKKEMLVGDRLEMYEGY